MRTCVGAKLPPPPRSIVNLKTSLLQYSETSKGIFRGSRDCLVLCRGGEGHFLSVIFVTTGSVYDPRVCSFSESFDGFLGGNFRITGC